MMKLMVLVFGAFYLATVNCAPDLRFERMLAAQFEEENGDNRKMTCNKNIPELAEELGLKDLVWALEYVDLKGALADKDNITVFGPNDKGFQDLPSKYFRFLEEHKKMLKDILEYHVIPGKILSGSLKNDQLVNSLLGKEVRINIYGNKVITASGQPIIKKDKVASNGVIHVISGVMRPPQGNIGQILANDYDYKSDLWAAINKAGLKDAITGDGPLTLLAPGNAAFEDLRWCRCWLLNNKEVLKKVLLNHVVESTQYTAGLTNGQILVSAQGDKLKVRKYKTHIKVGDAYITDADVTATNGVLQVIDKVLIPEELNNFCWDKANAPKVCQEASPDEQVPFIV